jgi:hypothetical protein
MDCSFKRYRGATSIRWQDLKARFCERFSCPPEDYEFRAFTQCLYWHALLLAPFVFFLNTSYFRIDFELIRELGVVSHVQDADLALLSFQDANRATRSFWRTGLNIRISGRKAANLARELFSEEWSQGGKV